MITGVTNDAAFVFSGSSLTGGATEGVTGCGSGGISAFKSVPRYHGWRVI